jgi:hypothetical protein
VITQAERDAVAGITVKDNVVVDIQYKNPDATLLACPSCNLPGTDDATACPACGLAFV